MNLLQIPFSHNCIKVRKALVFKGVPHTTEDISPMNRTRVRSASGQGLVPVLLDGPRAVCDSTAILMYVEARHPSPPLLPSSPKERIECMVLEDWVDAAFMALTRRLAYWKALATPGALEDLFLPGVSGLKRRVVGAIARRAVRRRFRISETQNRRDMSEIRRVTTLAVDRLGAGRFLVGDALSVADLALAALTAPLWAADPRVREHDAVRELLHWGDGILGREFLSYYRSTSPS